MKKVSITLMLATWLAITVHAQTAAPANNLFWSMTAFVKMDKRLEWEKKFTAFVKSHYPTIKYRAYEVISGPRTGAYVVVMGPMSYKDVDAFPASVKGQAAAMTESQVIDALCNSVEVNYYRRVNELSNANAQRKLKYLVVSQNEIVVGTWGDAFDYLKKSKEAREKGGSTDDIDYFRPSYSGAANMFASVRYVEKLEELENSTFNANEAYDKVFGNNSWHEDTKKYFSLIRENMNEIRVLRTDLSVQ
jgi:hypothetical protein